MKKFTSIQKACGWPVVYRQLLDTYGSDQADAVLDRAAALTEEYKGQYTGLKGIHKMHALSAVS